MAILRWGIIGCGDVSERKSVPGFQLAKGCQVSAVMSRNIDYALEFAMRHHVPNYFDDAVELIEAPFVDAVYIATPPDAHLALALKVAEAKKPCCVEKPFSRNFAEGKQLLNAFESRDIPLFASYYRRLLPRFQHVKSLLEQHSIGDIRSVSATLHRQAHVRDQTPHWRTSKERAIGGYFSDLGSHMIDLLQFLIGEIVEVSGHATNQQGLYSAPDAAVAHFRFANNIVGTGNWNFGSQCNEDSITIYGHQGHLTFSVFKDSPITLTRSKTTQQIYIPHPEQVQGPHIEAMISDIRGDSTSPCRAQHATRTLWVMDKILSNSH